MAPPRPKGRPRKASAEPAGQDQQAAPSGEKKVKKRRGKP
jgi:hypothetical protein